MICCLSICVPDAVAITLGKPSELYSNEMLIHPWSDKDSVVDIHLNECNGAQHVFNIAYLTPSLFSDNIVDNIF